MEVSGQDYKKVQAILSKAVAVDLFEEVLEDSTFVGGIKLVFMPIDHDDVISLFKEYHEKELPQGTRLSLIIRGVDLIITIYNLTTYLYVQIGIRDIQENVTKKFIDQFKRKLPKVITINANCGRDIEYKNKRSLFTIHQS